jgi:phage FluMu protein Com
MNDYSKKIYCPKCNRQVASYNGKTTANIDVKCNKCKKLVVYRPADDSVEIRELPKRLTASGKRFY